MVALALTGAAVVAMPPPAGSQDMATVTLQAEAVVGTTLTATLAPEDRAAVVEYRWQRCGTELRPTCVPIKEAASVPSYTVAAADLGNRLAVRVLSFVAGMATETWSPITGVVTAPPPVPTSAPKPTPTSKPMPGPKPYDESKSHDESRSHDHWKSHDDWKSHDESKSHDDSESHDGWKSHDKWKSHPKRRHRDDPSPPAAATPPPSEAEVPPSLLDPFPIVRVKGTLVRDGALISLLRVRAPSTATVDARCSGPRCHLRRRSFGSGRIAALERFMPNGTRITIRVSKPNSVGKYVRLVIRDGRAPKRRDACLIPGSGKPAECPAA